MIDDLIAGTRKLSKAMNTMNFSDPVHTVYNPLDYAREPHENYLRMAASTPKKILFLGMNPGPFGMMQTGIPFGEIEAVRDWIGIRGSVRKPANEHPKRPISGWDCTRSEVSGRRLWGLFRDRFGNPEAFFRDHFVLNYCPLGFLGDTGRNLTPDKISAAEMKPVYEACDQFLAHACELLEIDWAIGVGGFAEKRLQDVLKGSGIQIGKILHPSPASPAANRDWAGAVTGQMTELGLWEV